MVAFPQKKRSIFEAVSDISTDVDRYPTFHYILLPLLVFVTCSALSFEFGSSTSGATSPSSPSPPQTNPSNVQVGNTPSVHVLNIPTVRVQERNWQYRVIVIPKAIPGTPEWNDFLG